MRGGAVGWDGRTPSAKMSESGADRNTVGHPCRRLRQCSGDAARVTGRRRFSPGGPGRETENLGNWKSDIETGDPARQNFRFSEFQFFTRPQMHGSGGRGEGAILNVHFRGRSCRSLDGHHYIDGDYCTSGFVKGCKMPAPSHRPVSLHKNSTGRRLTSLEGGNRRTMPRGHGRQ